MVFITVVTISLKVMVGLIIIIIKFGEWELLSEMYAVLNCSWLV
jgi:hypothetical protein